MLNRSILCFFFAFLRSILCLSPESCRQCVANVPLLPTTIAGSVLPMYLYCRPLSQAVCCQCTFTADHYRRQCVSNVPLLPTTIAGSVFPMCRRYIYRWQPPAVTEHSKPGFTIKFQFIKRTRQTGIRRISNNQGVPDASKLPLFQKIWTNLNYHFFKKVGVFTPHIHPVA